MCGIVGHVSTVAELVDPLEVARATRKLAHRGPDGEGLLNLPFVSLGHRRLSILDISGSHQPWPSECGRYHIVFNGEIYNYLELKNELVSEGYRFKSQGDTEVLMAIFQRDGAACLDRLNGMFAFAVWDTHLDRLFIARDRVGKKPLYYAEGKDQLVFSSELSALLGFNFISQEINHHAVSDFFAHQFIGENRTIFKQVNKLPPAHYLTWQAGKVKICRYWHLPFPDEVSRNNTRVCEEFRHLLDDAIAIRLRSDVPLGAFLSGGLDSTIIAASIRRLGFELSTYTIGFAQGSFDESKQACSVSEQLGTKHHLKMIDIPVNEIVEQCLSSFGEPFADPSAIPTWYLCQYASSEVKVALSGDGVDELFAGYRRYRAMQIVQCIKKMPSWLHEGVIGSIVTRLPETDRYFATSVVKKIKLLYEFFRRHKMSPEDPLAQTFNLEERQRLLSSDLPASEVEFDFVSAYGLDQEDPVTQMLIADQQMYLPEDILTKIDRMSMQHGLEVRSPFLDYRIIEFAARLPLKYKLDKGEQKVLLRKCYDDAIPQEVLKRAKHGFAVPLATWFKGPLREKFQNLIFDLKLDNGLNNKEIIRLWHEHQSGRYDHGFKLWTIFVYSLWWKNQVKAS